MNFVEARICYHSFLFHGYRKRRVKNLSLLNADLEDKKGNFIVRECRFIMKLNAIRLANVILDQFPLRCEGILYPICYTSITLRVLIYSQSQLLIFVCIS